MRRVIFLVACAAILTASLHAQALIPLDPRGFTTPGARELINGSVGDTLLPEFSFIPADTSLRLIGSRLVVRSEGMPSIMLRVYRISRNRDGTIKSKVMLSADTVSVRIGKNCVAPYILTRFGDCAGDTSKVAPPTVGDTTRAPLSTTAARQNSAARSVPEARKPAPTFNQLLESDANLRKQYAQHPEIAPRHVNLPIGVDNQINPPVIATPAVRRSQAERVLPPAIPLRKKSPPSAR